jgi:uncharacterized membrane protein
VAGLNPADRSQSGDTGSLRLAGLDAHRGLIMVLMAIDHASYFVARVHSVEFWGAPLPVYTSVLWFLTRWVTHLCAPGFFLLMGIGMVLWTEARKKAGWEEGRMTSFFLVRGVFLLLLQVFIEDPAWMFGDLVARSGAMVFRGGVPGGGGGDGILYFGVLFALGGSMIFWSIARRLPGWLIAVISVAAIVCTQLATPARDHVSITYPSLLTLLIIPGRADLWTVFYPVVPWLGVTGLGLLFGSLLVRKPSKSPQVAAWAGVISILLFLCVRLAGGFGNLNDVPPGWIGFFNVVKYPPSLAFLSVTLGINWILMGFWLRSGPDLTNPYHPLLVFGRAPLFFYVFHLWIFALFGLAFRGGSDLASMLLFWLLGLAVLYPLCLGYTRFKAQTPLTSLWRFL